MQMQCHSNNAVRIWLHANGLSSGMLEICIPLVHSFDTDTEVRRIFFSPTVWRTRQGLNALLLYLRNLDYVGGENKDSIRNYGISWTAIVGLVGNNS